MPQSEYAWLLWGLNMNEKVEYHCEHCGKLDPMLCSGLDVCDRVSKASVVCKCGVKIIYPSNTPHPRFCKECAEKELRKHSQRHRKLDSFGEA